MEVTQFVVYRGLFTLSFFSAPYVPAFVWIWWALLYEFVFDQIGWLTLPADSWFWRLYPVIFLFAAIIAGYISRELVLGDGKLFGFYWEGRSMRAFWIMVVYFGLDIISHYLYLRYIDTIYLSALSGYGIHLILTAMLWFVYYKLISHDQIEDTKRDVKLLYGVGGLNELASVFIFYILQITVAYALINLKYVAGSLQPDPEVFTVFMIALANGTVIPFAYAVAIKMWPGLVGTKNKD